MNKFKAHAYSAYGFTATIQSTQHLLGFNGEYAQTLTSFYILGSGYRAYNTNLMRFISPDSLSPFGDGGINTYCYCNSDPINYADPSGHLTARRLISKSIPLTRSKLLLSLDSPAQVNTSYSRNAPPYFGSSPDVFSTAGTPPSYQLGKLPSYSKQLPKGHRKLITPSISPKDKPLPALPAYSEFKNKTRNPLPPEHIAAHKERLNEITGQYKRVKSNIRELERRNMFVPPDQRRTIERLRDERDFIRDLLNN